MQFFEKNISQFIENQFPSFYKEEGPVFISFVKAYYEWLEQEKNAIYHSRRILEYKDIDSTTSEFINFFKKKYLNSIQFNTATNTEQFIKHSLDLYKSKGTERSLDLFFKLVFGKPAEIYYPSNDVFKVSAGEWIEPKYLEVSYAPNLKTYVNKTIQGVSSGATTYIEKYIKKRNNGRDIHLFYITEIFGNFITNESLRLQNSIEVGPKLLGSLNSLDIIYGGTEYKIGDIVDIISDNYGYNGKARVANIASISGVNQFQLLDQGWGYTPNTEVLISEKVFYANDIIITNFETRKGFYEQFETVLQPLANVRFLDYTGETLANNDYIYRYNSNGISGKAEILTYSYITNTIGVSLISLIDGNFGLDYTISLENDDELVLENNITLSYNNYEYSSLYGQSLLDEELNIFLFENNDLFNTESFAFFKMNEISTEDEYIIEFENSDIMLTEFIGSAIFDLYEDISATANVIKNAANATINITESYSPFSNGTILYQVNNSTNNIIFTSKVLSSNYIGSNAVINLTNCEGLFILNEKIYSNSTHFANLVNIKSTYGVINIDGSFKTDIGNYVIGLNSNTRSFLYKISSGNGAAINISNNFNYKQNILYNDDYVRNYLNISINGIYPFPQEPTSNLNTLISDSLNYSNIQLGSISSIITINPGNNYDTAPMIVLYDKIGYNLNKKDYIIHYSNATSSFAVDEPIIYNNNDIALVKSSNTSSINAKRISVNEIENIISLENDYATRLLTENNDQLKNELYIFGEFSGTAAFVNSISNTDIRIGINAEVSSNVITSSGSVTKLDIIDTGFNYSNNELISFIGQSYNDNGLAISNVFGTGKSLGYYNRNDSELSANKKIHDSFYYQDFSYVIKSAVTLDKYKDMLDNILHMAGTKYFSEFIFEEETKINTTINNIEVELI